MFGVTLAADFVPIWKTLIGQTVQITGGRVYGARLDSALLSVPGWQQELVNVTFHIPNPYGLLDRTRFSERR